MDVFDYEDAKDKEGEKLDSEYYRLGFKQVDDRKKNKKSGKSEFDFDAEDPTEEEQKLDKEFQRLMGKRRFK